MGVHATDFEYDGHLLSDRGFIICEFDGRKGIVNSDPGSVITFTKVPRNSGRIHSLSSAVFNDCYKATFHICKNPELVDEMQISSEEYRSLMHWLNRRDFLPFRLIDDDYLNETCYYDASFNIKKIKIGEVLYGLELSIETNRPFGYGSLVKVSHTFSGASDQFLIQDHSDDIGYIYPSVKITVTNAGDLTLTSSYDNSTTNIKNCSVGEVIELDGNSMIIQSSVASHDIANDFNYEFPKIGNTLDNNINTITASAPCQVEVRYHPIIKEVF